MIFNELPQPQSEEKVIKLPGSGSEPVEKTHPCRRYIVYLLVRGFSDESVRTMIDKLGFPKPSYPYLERLKVQCLSTKPKNFRPRASGHAISKQWLREHEVFSLFHPHENVLTAQKILRKKELRTFVELLLAAKFNTEDLNKEISGRLHVKIKPDAIKLYEYYFFDIHALDKKSLQLFLSRYANGGDIERAMAIGKDYILYRLGCNSLENLIEHKEKLNSEAFMQGLQMLPRTIGIYDLAKREERERYSILEALPKPSVKMNLNFGDPFTGDQEERRG